MAAQREVFRIDDGEEARLTPGGPHAAVITSRGYLPLRYREEATSLRVAFPGTCVTLGGATFEVVSETADGEGVSYGLRPWSPAETVRQVVAYAPPLVRAAQHERRRLVLRGKAAPHRWLLAPLLGLLPEERQTRACDAVGVQAGTATLASGLLESLAILFTARAFAERYLAPVFTGIEHAADIGQSYQSGFVQAYLWGNVFTPVVGTLLAAALWRTLWALVYGEVAGSAPVVAFFALADRLRSRLEDETLVPITRRAFWARLALPDRVTRERDRSVLVRSLLPHVSWERTPRLRFGDDWWDVVTLGPASERGRLVHQYRLVPPPDAGGGPAPHDYADDVLAEANRGWDDLFAVGLGPLLTLLPDAVQQRAFAARGGRAAALVGTLATSLVQLGAGVWLARSGLAGMLLVAVWCVAEGLYRLARVATGRFAPSLLGYAFADLLPPERQTYLSHRDAEARSLLGGRRRE